MEREAVFQELKKSKKYKHLCDDTLLRISGWVLERYGPKNAVKAAKSKLHQVYGAYFEHTDFKKIKRLLSCEGADSPLGNLKKTALTILGSHRSSEERLSILDRFYRDLFQKTGQPKKILDLACGLHPFALPWMELEPGAEYLALDIDFRLVEVLEIFFDSCNPPGAAAHKFQAQCGDLLTAIPRFEADVTFLLKTMPCLEQQEKGASTRLLAALKERSRFIVISFPAQSLTGKDKGMTANYHRFMAGIAGDLGLPFSRLDYPTETIYILPTLSGNHKKPISRV